MRDRDEVLKAHAFLARIVKGEFPFRLGHDESLTVAAVYKTLRWMLLYDDSISEIVKELEAMKGNVT